MVRDRGPAGPSRDAAETDAASAFAFARACALDHRPFSILLNVSGCCVRNPTRPDAGFPQKRF
jgi:hypothetical protein